jgi:hypothetical protein
MNPEIREKKILLDNPPKEKAYSAVKEGRSRGSVAAKSS